MRLDANETVNVIVRTWPGASHVLRRHGLDDFLGWGGTPLGQACQAHGIDLELISGEILRQVDPDVAHAFRASPRAQRPVAPAAPPSEPPLAEEEPPPPPPVDDGIPDVASVFRVRAGSPDEPFLHARRPLRAPAEEAPAEEAPEQEQPEQEEQAAQDDLHPETQALLARREELRQQLELLVALRNEVLGQVRERPAGDPSQTEPAEEGGEEEEAVVAELVRLPEPEPEPAPVPLPEPEPELVGDAPSVPTRAGASSADELPPGEEGGLLSRMRSWFAA